jgi:hypothetical protein
VGEEDLCAAAAAAPESILWYSSETYLLTTYDYFVNVLRSKCRPQNDRQVCQNSQYNNFFDEFFFKNYFIF